MWKWWEPREPDRAGEVADECEAWLAGEWAEYRAARGRPVPGWAWLNQVVHAPGTAVREMTRTPACCKQRDNEWFRLRACVAESLVRQAAEKGMSIGELQRGVLLPIESALFRDGNLHRMGNPGLMMRVLAALRHPSAQKGPR